MTGPAPLAHAVQTTALALHVDRITAEVVTAMREVGIRPLLLKGPSIAVWLYGDGAARPYADSDLMVAPGSYRHAGEVLQELGFHPVGYSWHRDSQTWLRGSDRGNVDLHRSLIGAFAPPDTVWRELAAQTETMRVGGINVEVLRLPARALHIALHAAQHGDNRGTLEDLARALRVADESVWSEASDRARRIDALAAFAAGLRLDPDGVRLAERLRLPAERPALVALRADSDITVALGVESFASERSLRARARLLVRALVPPPRYVRRWSATHMTNWPAVVRESRLGLWVAYVWRPIWIVLRLPKAIAAVRHARRGEAQPKA